MILMVVTWVGTQNLGMGANERFFHEIVIAYDRLYIFVLSFFASQKRRDEKRMFRRKRCHFLSLIIFLVTSHNTVSIFFQPGKQLARETFIPCASLWVLRIIFRTGQCLTSPILCPASFLPGRKAALVGIILTKTSLSGHNFGMLVVLALPI